MLLSLVCGDFSKNGSQLLGASPWPWFILLSVADWVFAPFFMANLWYWTWTTWARMLLLEIKAGKKKTLLSGLKVELLDLSMCSLGSYISRKDLAL